MATNGKTPRDLLATRINRLEKQGAETNKRLHRVESLLGETNQRLDQVITVLQSIANILNGHTKQLEQHNQRLARQEQLLEALTERLERFADMVILGRTRDTEKIGELERRVETLERQVFPGAPPPRG
jgi:DNA repair ATPase RecN